MEATTRFGGMVSDDSTHYSIRLLSVDDVVALTEAAYHSHSALDKVVRCHLGFPSRSERSPYEGQTHYEAALDQFHHRINYCDSDDLVVAQVSWSKFDTALIYTALIYVVGHTEGFSDDVPAIPWTMGGISCTEIVSAHYDWSSFEESVDSRVSLPALVGAMLGKEFMTEAVSHFKKGADLAEDTLKQTDGDYVKSMDALYNYNVVHRSMRGSIIVERVADPRAFELENRSAKVAENATKFREALHSASAWVDALEIMEDLDRLAAYSSVPTIQASKPAGPIIDTTSTVLPRKSEMSALETAVEAIQRLAGAMPDRAVAGGGLAPVIPTADVPAAAGASDTAVVGTPHDLASVVVELSSVVAKLAAICKRT
jgi:hypothetical protein